MSLTIIGIGTGELAEKAADLTSQLNVASKVRLISTLSHDKTKLLMMNSDAFILCSKTAQDGDMEGIPTVLMEALSLGLPCVSTRHSGIPEIIPERCHSLLAQEGDVDEILKCMKRLVDSPDQKTAEFTRLGREKIEQEFNLEIETKKLIKLYSRQLI